MGTNFYLIRECCEHCGRGSDQIHIGKSSAGWVFSLNTHPDEGINTLKDWEEQWSQPSTRIVDEYGDVITLDEMRKRILKRSWNGSSTNLRRHPIDGFCVAHGDGTYDVMRGEFS